MITDTREALSSILPRLFWRFNLSSPDSWFGRRAVDYERERAECFWDIYQRLLGSTRIGENPEEGWFLEFGVGPGFLLLQAEKQRKGRVVGIDIQDQRSSSVKGSMSQQSTPFVLYDGRNLPFADHSFAAVSVTSILHHIPVQEHEGVCQELKRILKPAGVLLVQEDLRGKNCLEHLAIRVLDWIVSGPEANSHRSQKELVDFLVGQQWKILGDSKRVYRCGPFRLEKLFLVVQNNR